MLLSTAPGSQVRGMGDPWAKPGCSAAPGSQERGVGVTGLSQDAEGGSREQLCFSAWNEEDPIMRSWKPTDVSHGT